MTLETSTRKALLASIPQLRAFAVSLCGTMDRADDLVQETLLRAIAHIDSFQSGTNMNAWLFTILHNHFRSDCRKRKWTAEDPDGEHAGSVTVPPEQDGWSTLADLRAGLAALSDDHRAALILVGASGLSCEDAAAICGCPVGTIKSRINRAREQLSEFLSDHADDEAASPMGALRRPTRSSNARAFMADARI